MSNNPLYHIRDSDEGWDDLDSIYGEYKILWVFLFILFGFCKLIVQILMGFFLCSFFILM